LPIAEQPPADGVERRTNYAKLAASSSSVVAVAEAHGWRLGRVLDPFGHHWEIGRPLR
jgi:uncharacterized glyoxalase superfamily protein PhnB